MSKDQLRTEEESCHAAKSCSIRNEQNGDPGLVEFWKRGQSYPLGSSVSKGGINFTVFSTCSELDLLLFDEPNAGAPSKTIKLDPKRNRTFHYWHIFVPGLKNGQVYGYRAYGQNNRASGFRFDHEKVLLDPYCRAVANTENYSRRDASRPGDNCRTALRSVAIDTSNYDWEDDHPPRTPYCESVIYELHVAGFTKSQSSGLSADKRGTFVGLQAKIPYLKSLGITAVELMPIHQFDTQDAASGLCNYWGYSPIAYFAAHSGYSSAADPTKVVDEFRDLVKALHKEGIEVILDVVFNHTAEGDEAGPLISLKGLANSTYYILDSNKPASYANFSGCGNSLRGNNSICQRLIVDCLRFWVSEMHVDGFRFDLASTLSRDVAGSPQSIEFSSILSSIESDPILAGSKLIAEAWDASGFYQIGSFLNKSDWFAEWNGPFRDDIRRFLKGDSKSAGAAAVRISGSSDIYLKPDREPNRSIQFITCHDGFTLSDLVSYNQKHNQANGEDNADGSNLNFSWNCGFEGLCEKSEIQDLRSRQIKNFLTVLFFSQGTPMLLMGDEIRRSQQGNNNAYCQDNELSWFDWNLTTRNADIFEFTKGLITFTQKCSLIRQDHLLCTMRRECCCSRIVWHGTKLEAPDWSEESHSLAYSLFGPGKKGDCLHVMINAFWHPLAFEIPSLDDKSWRAVVNTALSTKAFQPPDQAVEVAGKQFVVAERSSAVLFAGSE